MPAHDVLKLRILACKSTVNIICKAFERQAAQNNPFMFSEFIFSTAKVSQKTFTIDFLLRLISGFMRPIKTKIPPFDLA